MTKVQIEFAASAYALAYRLQDSDDSNIFDAYTSALVTARTILSNCLGAVKADEVHTLMSQRERETSFAPAQMIRDAIEKITREHAEYDKAVR